MKSSSTRPGPCKEILEEAAAWFVEFRDGGADALAHDNFNRWLRRSPDHIRAYLEIAGVWADLPQAQAAAAVDVPALVADARACAKVVTLESASVHHSAQSPRPSRFKFASRLAAAACALLVCAAALFIWLQRVDYSTDIGEQRFVTLPDSSTVVLNARSQMEVRFTDKERTIELLAGQALFDVSADPGRPFVVISGETRVRAVGTQFDVYRKKTATVVTVVEGRVAVSAFDPDASLISAGEQVTVTPGAIRPAATVDVAAATAWTQRRLIFNSTRLADVAEEFNRYNPRPLVVEDGALAQMRISGIYSSTDPTSLLSFLKLQPGIGVVENEKEIQVVNQ